MDEAVGISNGSVWVAFWDFSQYSGLGGRYGEVNRQGFDFGVAFLEQEA